MMSNILIGKFGKSVNFEPMQWGMIGGDSESAILAQSIAHLYPDDKFYLVSRNNFSKLPIDIQMKINKNNNLIDCWKNYDKSINNQDWLIKYFKNIKIDFGLLYSGLSGSTTIENYMQTQSGEYAKPMSFSKNYTGIITKFLNETNIPYMEIGEDSRFFPLVARDLHNRSKRILSVVNTVLSTKHIESKENQTIVTTKTPVSDIGHSHAFLMSEDKSKLLHKPNTRNTLISIFMHGTASHHKTVNKGKIIEDYILDNFPETKIYGKWDLSTVSEKYHDNIKEIPMIDLHDVLYDTKYSLLTGGSNDYPTSSKFWKFLIFGIVPFFIKKEDIEKFELPNFLFVKDGNELKNKIEKLENSIDLYNDMWYGVQNKILKDDLWNGNHFFDKIEKWVKHEFGHNMKRKGTISYRSSSLFVKEELNTLENFMV